MQKTHIFMDGGSNKSRIHWIIVLKDLWDSWNIYGHGYIFLDCAYWFIIKRKLQITQMMDTNVTKKKWWTQVSGPDGNNETSNVIIQTFGVHYYCPLFSL